MGLRRRELRLSSSIRRTGSWQSVAASQTFSGTTDATFDTTGKTITKFQCWGSAGDATGGFPDGGGGGGYAEVTLGLPSPMPALLRITIFPTVAETIGNTVANDAGGAVYCQAACGLSGGDGGSGGILDNCIGDVTHSGGDGGPMGGGRAGSALANGASNSPGGTSPGDGGDPPAGTGQPGRVVITWT